MEELSFKELKAQNAKEQEDVAVDDNLDQEVLEDNKQELNTGKVADTEVNEVELDDTEEAEELEAWMQIGDEDTPDNGTGGFRPNHEAAKRRKQNKALRGQIKEADSENETLRARIAELESGTQHNQIQEVKLKPRPTREDFDFDEDAYDKAIDDWNDQRFDMKLAKHANSFKQEDSKARAQKKAQQQLEDNISDHYDKANKLVSDGVVTKESYSKADQNVRRAIEGLYPDNGDAITDRLISTLNTVGGGSEKVMYLLGVNKSKLNELVDHLTLDPNGMNASAYLGVLQREVQGQSKRRSQAPKPGSKVDGEGGSSLGGKLMKKYQKSTNVQDRISMKRKAKLDGIDVSNW